MKAFLHFVTQDWYFAIPMLCMSLVAVTLVVWRLLLNMCRSTEYERFLPAFQEKLAERRRRRRLCNIARAAGP